MDRVGVIGAGPVGLYAAYRLVKSGHRVVVWEKGQVGGNVDKWAHVTLFSALSLNLPEDARQDLEAGLGEACGPRSLAGGDAFLTGGEFRRDVLLPLAAWLRASGRCEIVEGRAVAGLGRGALLKKEGVAAIGDDRRSSAPFRALLRSGDGAETLATVSAVVDCSGTYAAETAARAGSGGLSAPGEAAAEAAGRVTRVIPDPAREPGLVAGKRVAILGAGYSAITTLKALADLEGPAAPKAIYWLLRKAEAPYDRVADDPLPQRDTLAKYGNGLAAVGATALRGGGAFEAIRGVEVSRVASVGDGLELELAGPGAARTLAVDHLISLTGFRPDAGIYSELHVHQCYASDGPMKLAATLLAAAAGGGGGDCLKQAAPGVGTLLNPEPDFFILGMKSYGRNSAFLMRVGYEQVSLLVDKLRDRAPLPPFDAPAAKPDAPNDNAAPAEALLVPAAA